ncbi:MAG: hypothetical protein JXQ29_11305 [Planctomycetes bacterium]|nr:hypothetical protein [Planctomycetota bacterium]
MNARAAAAGTSLLLAAAGSRARVAATARPHSGSPRLRLGMLLVLAVFWSAASPPSAAQEGPTAAELAVYRGQPVGADALAKLSELDRAWLEAARKPALERARLLLALADVHPELGERALLGAAGALLTARRLALDVPGLWPGEDDYVEIDDQSLASIEATFEPMTRQVEQLHERLRERGADADVLAEARWMLRLLRRTGDFADSMQVPSGSELRIPAPRRHDLELRWFPSPDIEPDAVELDRRLPELEPERTERVPAGNEVFVTHVPGPGFWLLEVRETPTGWRHTRPVLVSDLGFDCLTAGSHVVVCARLGDRPASGATVSVRRASGLPIAEGTCDGQGLATLAISPLGLETIGSGYAHVEVRSGAHVARADVSGVGQTLAVSEGLRAHVFCERPLYRPGETVHGRIFVRRIEAVDGRPAGTPVRGGFCALRLWPGRKDEQLRFGMLNASGVLTFVARIPETTAHGRVAGQLELGGEKLDLQDLFRVDPFRRSPLLVELEAPQRLAPGPAATAELRARWSHGPVAAGAPVQLRARIWPLTHELETRLGRDGTLRIELPHDEAFFTRRGQDLELSATVRGPDGQGVTRTCEIGLPEDPPDRRDDRPGIAASAQPAPGAEACFCLRCEPGAQGLCVLWTRDHLEARAVRFDAAGRAELAFTIPRDTRGKARVEFVAAGHHARRSVPIAAPEEELRIALETETRRYRPGSGCRVALRVTDGAGEPVRAILCASVVDERLLALEDVDDAAAVERFGKLEWWWKSHGESARQGLPEYLGDLWWWMTRRSASAWPTVQPWDVIGRMLGVGRPRTWPYNAPGSPTPCPTPIPDLGALDVPEELFRKRFCPSAGYQACLRTDAAGRASYEFELPDDLTTWRLRVVAVDEALGQGAACFPLVTEKPLSVEVALPRFLRLGDRIRTTPVVSGEAATAPEWTARTSDELALAREESLASGIELRARSRGEARVELGVRAGECSDALRRVLPIQRDTVREPLQTNGTVTTLWQVLTLPGADELEELVIGAGSAALLAGLREELATYPYRCAEQTSSRLLGLFGRHVPEGGTAALDAEVMFARLIQLWHPQSLLYSWWPRQEGDPGITALVFHTLSELKAAGHPLGRYGLDVNGSCAGLQALAEAARVRLAAADPPDIVGAEHAIALLRLVGRNTDLVAAVQSFLQKHAGLPRGLLCRAGLAFLAAGERDAALEIARSLRGPGPTRFRGLRLGEGERVQLAFELRLRQALGLDDAATREIEERLLRHIEGHGFEHTWSAACALHALASGGIGETPVAASAAEVRIDGVLRKITLDAKDGHRAKVVLHGKPRVEVRSADGTELRVRLLGARGVAAESFAARGNGLSVQRSILEAGAGSFLERGRIYRIALDVAAEHTVSYLVVRCPLPAGCEPHLCPSDIERHDDAVVAMLPFVSPAKPRRIEVPVVFGFEGSVLWPPVDVREMYDETIFALSAGSRLRIVPERKIRAEDRAVVAVLPEAWRRAGVEGLLENALQAQDPDRGAEYLRDIHGQRLALTAAQCAKWLEPLFARHGSCYACRAALFDLPGVPDAPGEPATAFEVARAYHRSSGDLALRRRILEAPDAVFECMLAELAWDTSSSIEEGIAKSLRVESDIRHEVIAECPASLASELAFAEAIFARVERCSASWDENVIGALEDLGDISTSASSGAAEGPVEAGIRERLAGLRKCAAALRARHVRPEVRSDEERYRESIEEHRWKEVPRAHWPVELQRLYREDVDALAALGEEGIRYLIAQANGSAEIDDPEHWLRTLASGPSVDLAVLTPLVEDSSPRPASPVVPAELIRRVPLSQLVAACLCDPLPLRRALYLRELARRGAEFPLCAEHPVHRPWHLFWQCLHGAPGSRAALEQLLLADDTPYDFTRATWSALLPDPSYRVFARFFPEMTDAERALSFAHLGPAKRRRALEEFDLDALPATLSDELLRELHDELWRRILADPIGEKPLLKHFLRSEPGFHLLREQLAHEHDSNHAIAEALLLGYGLSLPFRTGGGLLLRLDASDPDTRRCLALQWLDEGLAVPHDPAAMDYVRHVLRRRGCSLR